MSTYAVPSEEGGKCPLMPFFFIGGGGQMSEGANVRTPKLLVTIVILPRGPL